MNARPRTLRGAAALCVSLSMVPATWAGTLEVQLRNLRPTGTVHVAVFGDAPSWARQRGPVAIRVFAARDISEILRIDGLAPGRYAVSVDQDASDGSGLLEPPSFAVARHGDSGNGREGLMPSFERASVSIGDEDPSVSVHLFAATRY